MNLRTRAWNRIVVGIALGLIMAGCGSPEVEVDFSGAAPGAAPLDPALQGSVNMPTADERQAMLEATRIAAEAARTGKMPPAEQMSKLTPEQQEAVRRAVEARGGTSP